MRPKLELRGFEPLTFAVLASARFAAPLVNAGPSARGFWIEAAERERRGRQSLAESQKID